MFAFAVILMGWLVLMVVVIEFALPFDNPVGSLDVCVWHVDVCVAMGSELGCGGNWDHATGRS